MIIFIKTKCESLDLLNVVVKLCHHFAVYCLTRQTVFSLRRAYTRKKKAPSLAFLSIFFFVTEEAR